MTEGISLDTLKGGTAVELVNEAIQTVLENIVDPNTDAEAKRKVTLALIFSPAKARDMLGLRIEVKTALASPVGHDATIFIAHTKDGVVALEHNPDQGQLFTEEAEGGDVETFPKAAEEVAP